DARGGKGEVRVDCPGGLGRGAGEIDDDAITGNGELDLVLRRSAAGNAAVVDPLCELRLAVGQHRDLGARQALRIIDQLGHVGFELGDVVLLEQLVDLAFSGMYGADLRLDVG